MNRSETITIRVRRDLKDGFKELFKGEMVSNAFEKLVIAHIKKERAECRSKCFGMVEALTLYIEKPNYSKAVETSLKAEIDKYREEVERLDNVAEMMRIDI